MYIWKLKLVRMSQQLSKKIQKHEHSLVKRQIGIFFVIRRIAPIR